MKIFDVIQGSPEWIQLRCGVPTASEFGDIMTTKFELRDSAGYWTYVYRKVAENLTGPLPSFGGKALDQGHFLEPEAVPFFEMETGLDARRVGFCLSDDCRCGCSPDALVGDDSGLEIKSPGAVNHVRYVCEGKVPLDYIAQVHGSMFVTGRAEWHFMSYHRRVRPLHLVVKRDEAIMEKIEKCLERFYADFDKTMAKVEERKEMEAAL